MIRSQDYRLICSLLLCAKIQYERLRIRLGQADNSGIDYCNYHLELFDKYNVYSYYVVPEQDSLVLISIITLPGNQY